MNRIDYRIAYVMLTIILWNGKHSINNNYTLLIKSTYNYY